MVMQTKLIYGVLTLGMLGTITTSFAMHCPFPKELPEIMLHQQVISIPSGGIWHVAVIHNAPQKVGPFFAASIDPVGVLCSYGRSLTERIVLNKRGIFKPDISSEHWQQNAVGYGFICQSTHPLHCHFFQHRR